jgi:hypothetical protein
LFSKISVFISNSLFNLTGSKESIHDKLGK